MLNGILDFMGEHIHCVISTVSDANQPESAMVGFSCNKILEIIFGTSNESRKYKNLLGNPDIAIVIGDSTAEIQYEGLAEVIPQANYTDLIENQHIKKIPGAAKYRDDPHQVYFKVTPKWIRYTQHNETNIINEFTEFA